MIKPLIPLIFLASLNAQTLNTINVGHQVLFAENNCSGFPNNVNQSLLLKSLNFHPSVTSCGMEGSFAIGTVAQFHSHCFLSPNGHGSYVALYGIGTASVTAPNCYPGIQTNLPIPNGAQGCSSFHLQNFGFYYPQWVIQVPILGQIYDYFILEIPIPNNPSLVGVWFQSQSFRLDISTQQIVASGLKEVTIV
jgi:hypothetical protein